jgi:hypothetical protein
MGANADRRDALKTYAQEQLRTKSQAQAFLNIVDKAIDLSQTAGAPLERHGIVIEDLQQVLVGDNLLTGRTEGPHFVGREFTRGVASTGFKDELHIDADTGFSEPLQIEHAAAALVISYRYGSPGEKYSLLVEDKAHDTALYNAVFPVGEWFASLASQNLAIRAELGGLSLSRSPDRPTPDERAASAQAALDELPGRLLEAICDNSCTLPDPVEDAARYPTSEALPPSELAQALDDALYPTSDAGSPEEQSQALDDALYPTSEMGTPEQQAQPLDDALYPTSEAGSPEEQSRALDQALYPTSVPQSVTEQEMSAPATADQDASSAQPQQAPDPQLPQEVAPASTPDGSSSVEQDAHPTSQPEESATASTQEMPTSESGAAAPSQAEETEVATPEQASTESQDEYPTSEAEEAPVSEAEEAPGSEGEEAPKSEAPSSEAGPTTDSAQEDYPVSEPEGAYPTSEPEEAPAEESEPAAEEQPAESGGDGGGNGG